MFHRCQLIKKNIMLRANSRHLANFFHLVGIPYVVPEIGLIKVTFIQILYCKLFQSQAFTASLFLLSAPFSQYFFNVILYFHTADNVKKKLFYPQIFAVPPVGAVIPVNMLKRVVFPAPLCPKMAVISLGYIFKLMPLTALTGSWPKALNVFSRLEMTSASVSRNWTGISSISGPSKRCWLSSLLLPPSRDVARDSRPSFSCLKQD